MADNSEQEDQEELKEDLRNLQYQKLRYLYLIKLAYIVYLLIEILAADQVKEHYRLELTHRITLLIVIFVVTLLSRVLIWKWRDQQENLHTLQGILFITLHEVFYLRTEDERFYQDVRIQAFVHSVIYELIMVAPDTLRYFLQKLFYLTVLLACNHGIHRYDYIVVLLISNLLRIQYTRQEYENLKNSYLVYRTLLNASTWMNQILMNLPVQFCVFTKSTNSQQIQGQNLAANRQHSNAANTTNLAQHGSPSKSRQALRADRSPSEELNMLYTNEYMMLNFGIEKEQNLDRFLRNMRIQTTPYSQNLLKQSQSNPAIPLDSKHTFLRDEIIDLLNEKQLQTDNLFQPTGLRTPTKPPKKGCSGAAPGGAARLTGNDRSANIAHPRHQDTILNFNFTLTNLSPLGIRGDQPIERSKGLESHKFISYSQRNSFKNSYRNSQFSELKKRISIISRNSLIHSRNKHSLRQPSDQTNNHAGSQHQNPKNGVSVRGSLALQSQQNQEMSPERIITHNIHGHHPENQGLTRPQLSVNQQLPQLFPAQQYLQSPQHLQIPHSLYISQQLPAHTVAQSPVQDPFQQDELRNLRQYRKLSAQPSPSNRSKFYSDNLTRKDSRLRLEKIDEEKKNLSGPKQSVSQYRNTLKNNAAAQQSQNFEEIDEAADLNKFPRPHSFEPGKMRNPHKNTPPPKLNLKNISNLEHEEFRSVQQVSQQQQQQQQQHVIELPQNDNEDNLGRAASEIGSNQFPFQQQQFQQFLNQQLRFQRIKRIPTYFENRNSLQHFGGGLAPAPQSQLTFSLFDQSNISHNKLKYEVFARTFSCNDQAACILVLQDDPSIREHQVKLDVQKPISSLQDVYLQRVHDSTQQTQEFLLEYQRLDFPRVLYNVYRTDHYLRNFAFLQKFFTTSLMRENQFTTFSVRELVDLVILQTTYLCEYKRTPFQLTFEPSQSRDFQVLSDRDKIQLQVSNLLFALLQMSAQGTQILVTLQGTDSSSLTLKAQTCISESQFPQEQLKVLFQQVHYMKLQKFVQTQSDDHALSLKVAQVIQSLMGYDFYLSCEFGGGHIRGTDNYNFLLEIKICRDLSLKSKKIVSPDLNRREDDEVSFADNFSSDMEVNRQVEQESANIQQVYDGGNKKFIQFARMGRIQEEKEESR